MKRQSLVLLAVAFVAAGAAGCFSDPVKPLRSGPTILSVDHSAVFVHAGDSTAVTATILDNGGNVLPETDASWTSANTAMAVVRKDTTVIPGNYLTRAFIRGIDSISGGWTSVIVATRGVADTIRVTVLPAKLNKTLVATAGATLTDTVLVPFNPGPPAVAAKAITYTAKDTLVLTGTSIISFDTSRVAVSIATSNGTAKGFVVSKTPSVVKAVFQTGAAGHLMVNHVISTPGNSLIGAIAIDTLIGDSVAVAPWRLTPAFGASVVQAGDTMTITAGTNETFTSSTLVTFTGPSDSVGPVDTAIVMGQTGTTINVLAPRTRAGFRVTVRSVQMAGAASVGTITFDSLKTNDLAYSMTGATFPSANVSVGGGKLGDTITITAPAGLAFDPAASIALVGNTTVNTSDTAWILSRSAGTIKAFARRGGGSPVTVTNLKLPGGGAIPALTTPTAFPIDSVASDIAFSQTQGGAIVLTIPASDTLVTYGTTPPAGNSYTTFTTTATQAIRATALWFGSGNPYGSGTNTTKYTEDLDLLLCNAATKCDESAADLANFAGATTVNPQTLNVAALPAAQYWINVAGFNVGYSILYKLTVILH